MSNPFVFEFKLRQHTPIIHFQHNQPQATLRATEVKPKLDQFLIGRMTQISNNPKEANEVIKQKYPHYLVGGKKAEHVALDYKLVITAPDDIRITAVGTPRLKRKENKKIWEHGFPSFFANMGKSTLDERKVFSFTESPIICKLIALNKYTSDIFNKESFAVTISSFFLYHNFGTRQSKGFGSFTLIEWRGKEVKYNLAKTLAFELQHTELNQLPFSIREFTQILAENGYQNNSLTDWYAELYKVFEAIDLFYRTLRSGINIPNKFYFKSLMFHYAKNLNPPQQWDKKTIRLHFFETHREFEEVLRRHPIEDDPEGTLHFKAPNPNLIFRDLLGLATEQEWGKYDKAKVTKTVKNGSHELARFRSPLIFKPIRGSKSWKIYILTVDVPEFYLNSTVQVNADSPGAQPIDLHFPNTFSIEKYLKWAINYYRERTEEDEGFFLGEETLLKARENKIITHIYSSLS